MGRLALGAQPASIGGMLPVPGKADNTPGLHIEDDATTYTAIGTNASNLFARHHETCRVPHRQTFHRTENEVAKFTSDAKHASSSSITCEGSFSSRDMFIFLTAVETKKAADMTTRPFERVRNRVRGFAMKVPIVGHNY